MKLRFATKNAANGNWSTETAMSDVFLRPTGARRQCMSNWAGIGL